MSKLRVKSPGVFEKFDAIIEAKAEALEALDLVTIFSSFAWLQHVPN